MHHWENPRRAVFHEGGHRGLCLSAGRPDGRGRGGLQRHGDVLENGTILAGARDDSGRGFADSEAWLVAHGQRQRDVFSGKLVGENTVIGCVVTNAAMNKAQATKLAAVAQNGIARGVRPANATFDGDCLFAMCHGTVQADPDAVGILAARAVEEAIVRGVKAAESLHGRIALRDL